VTDVQLTTRLVESLKAGKIVISENNVPQLEIKATEKKIDINAPQKRLIKDVLASVREANNKEGLVESMRRTVGVLREANRMRPLVKEVVEDLCREGVTITVSYKGARVVTIGSEADSKYTRLVTGTKGVEINSPRKLAEMST
jgi:hypothetical protein